MSNEGQERLEEIGRLNGFTDESDRYVDEEDSGGPSEGKGPEVSYSLEGDESGKQAPTEKASDKALTDEEIEQRREARRQSRHQRSARKRKVIDEKAQLMQHLIRENEEMKHRLQAVESRSVGSDRARLEGAIQQQAQRYNDARERYVNASAAGDHAAALEAQEEMLDSRENFNSLQQRHQQFMRAVGGQGQPRTQTAPSESSEALDPRATILGQKWMQDNADWYDPMARDETSREARRIDQELRSEGWDPADPAYWEELQERVNEELLGAAPEATTNKKTGVSSRSKQGYNGSSDVGRVAARQTRRQITGGSGRESQGSGSTGFVLSRARKEAMVEAGLWDDPQQRNRVIKRYMEMDGFKV